MLEKPEILLDKLNKITDDISALLDSRAEFDQSGINQLDALYAERRYIIEAISAFTESPEGSAFISQSSILWGKRISSIMYADKINISRIKDILNQKQSDLKSILSQKSLLIYSKDNSHGY